MMLSELQPRQIRGLISKFQCETRSELKATIANMPKKQYVRWKRLGKVSAQELDRCQRYAEIIDCMRECQYGVPAYAVATCVEDDMYRVYRDLRMMVKAGLLDYVRNTHRTICEGNPAGLYFLK